MDLQAYLRTQKRLEARAYAYRDLPHGQWPKVRDLARSLSVRQQEVLDMAEDSESLDICIGLRCGGGYAVEDRIGDYSIEWVGEERPAH